VFGIPGTCELIKERILLSISYNKNTRGNSFRSHAFVPGYVSPVRC